MSHDNFQKKELHRLLDVILDSGDKMMIDAIKGDLQVLSKAVEQEEELKRMELETEKLKGLLKERS